jgi:hypothetical protein
MWKIYIQILESVCLISFHLVPHILFSNALNPCRRNLLEVRDQVPHPYDVRDIITYVYILTLKL